MSLSLLVLLLPMLLIPLGCWQFYGHEIKWQEALAQAAIGCLTVGLVYTFSMSSQMSDTEFINGLVTGKEQVRVSCSHSYSCHCHMVSSGSGKKRSSHKECDTCYEHTNDWDWRVFSTVGDFNISRIDSRGSWTPPRWSQVAFGQPVAMPHTYTNYVQAAPASIFHAIAPDDVAKLPKYPTPYDYQFADRFISNGVAIPNLRDWNYALAMVNARVGKPKQANIVMIVSNEASRDFADRVKRAWLGGKKNDIVVVVGAPHYPDIAWVEVFSWAKHDIVNINLREALMGSKRLDINTTLPIIERGVMQDYERRPMAEFEYLAKEVSPPMWVLILALILGSVASLGAARIFSRNNF